MTWKEMGEKIQEDLNIPYRRASKYVMLFRKQFIGYKEAIDTVEASYTDDGAIRIDYTICGNTNTKLI